MTKSEIATVAISSPIISEHYGEALAEYRRIQGESEPSARVIREEIAEFIRKQLALIHLKDDITLAVNPHNVIIGDGWYRVLVRPSREPENYIAYMEAMVELELSFSDDWQMNILLSTGDPIDE